MQIQRELFAGQIFTQITTKQMLKMQILVDTGVSLHGLHTTSRRVIIFSLSSYRQRCKFVASILDYSPEGLMEGLRDRFEGIEDSRRSASSNIRLPIVSSLTPMALCRMART